MPKKKGQNKSYPKDFTINDFADTQKPGCKPKKSIPEPKATTFDPSETSWDEIPEDVDIEFNPDGTTNFVTKSIKKENDSDKYPEIIWYLISRRIAPQDIGRFALINRTTCAITYQKAFWVHVYEKYCKYSPLLPKRLKIEDEPKTYGLKTRVVLALYRTHNFFLHKIKKGNEQPCNPHELLKQRCVGFDYCSDNVQGTLFFKFKQVDNERVRKVDSNFLKELEKLDANPEKDVKLLQVKFDAKSHLSKDLSLMGLTLTSVKMGLSKSLRSHKLTLGFNNGSYFNKEVLPEFVICLDPLKSIRIYDWWHPNYPYFRIGIQIDPREREEDDVQPVLDRDFFAPCDDEQDDSDNLLS